MDVWMYRSGYNRAHRWMYGCIAVGITADNAKWMFHDKEKRGKRINNEAV
jgi:hypothetical protein